MRPRMAHAPTWWLLVRHVVPNTMAPMLVVASIYMANAILIEASLSFLGLGITPPEPSWGNIITDGQPYLQNGLVDLDLPRRGHRHRLARPALHRRRHPREPRPEHEVLADGATDTRHSRNRAHRTDGAASGTSAGRARPGDAFFTKSGIVARRQRRQLRPRSAASAWRSSARAAPARASWRCR